ncbi:hypothetical protein Naga_100034g36 [Nannochloropsis gaditana]|uniref:Uncharacterized protein n=1 Tax=Nannochloropsis gaditana TaxID=72520 RepID=W7U4R6_9STRA|nr:hypothetical protein Naga_100034g36 [Nannochloropsis gaditana]
MELFATSAMYGHPPHDLSPFQIKGVTLSPPRIFGGGRLKNFFVFSFPIEKSSSKVVGRGVNLPSLLPPCQDKEKQVEENLDKDVQGVRCDQTSGMDQVTSLKRHETTRAGGSQRNKSIKTWPCVGKWPEMLPI